jgi:hypothetical protein
MRKKRDAYRPRRALAPLGAHCIYVHRIYGFAAFCLSWSVPCLRLDGRRYRSCYR